MKDKQVSKLWVFNKDTGSLSRKTLTYRENEMEAWYEDTQYHTYDPFYVDLDKQILTDRVYLNLTEDLQETLSEAERLMNFIRKLTRKY